MNTNLFLSLFKYRPRPNRRPLEDFVTECIGYFLKNDKDLLKKYLSFLFKKEIQPDDVIRVETQYPVDCGRIDIAIGWVENEIIKSLFIEHKVWSSPWEYENDEGIKNDQVTTYCKYQNDHTIKSIPDNYVVLISNYLVPGYSKEEKDNTAYLGNFTWWDISQLLSEHINEGNVQHNILLELEKEFINFMRRENMSGFEDFTIDELVSIQKFKSYEEKRNSFVQQIGKYFKTDIFNSYKLSGIISNGEGKLDGLYGALYHNAKENKAADIVEGTATLWIFFGLYLINDEYFPNTSYPKELIPDVFCGFIRWFDNKEEIEHVKSRFELTTWSKEKNDHFDVILHSGVDSKGKEVHYIALAKCESLLFFLQKDNHEQEILKFLDNGYKLIINGSKSLNKILQAFL